MASTIRWELYRSFLSVLEEGSLSGAARALGITQPTVGRHIAALEQGLGLALFTRSQVGLMPTAIALSLQTHAEAMDHTAAVLERAASSGGQEVQGVVRVSASDIIGVEVLPPIIAHLSARYPDLRIELVLTDRVQDLLRREADIAVRMVTPDQLQLIARRIGLVEIGLYAHLRYIERHGMPTSMSSLAEHTVIGYNQTSAFIRKLGPSIDGFGRELFSIRTDSNVAQLALIRSAVGIGACQALMAKRDPDLTRVLAKQFSIQLETWVTMHEGLRNNAACRVTFDALVKGLQAYVG